MSGGHFDYNQLRIKEIAREVAQIIKYNGKKDLYPKPEHYEDPWVPKYDWDNQCIFNAEGEQIGFDYELSDDIIQEFKTGLKIILQAYSYAQRIDWLISGDDGEDSFKRRLTKELNELDVLEIDEIVEKLTDESGMW